MKKIFDGGTTLLIIGFVVGVGSALTGTGGPLLLVPILIWRKVPVLMAIGLAQVIQIPISLTATVGNLAYGQVDFALGITLAVIMAVCSVIGAKTAHILPVALLKKMVAILLALVGASMLIKMLLQA